jgi:hypothetical protein
VQRYRFHHYGIVLALMTVVWHLRDSQEVLNLFAKVAAALVIVELTHVINIVDFGHANHGEHSSFATQLPL